MFNQETHPDALFKVILLGDSGVGKSSFLYQYTDTLDHTHTQNASEKLEFRIKDHKLNQGSKILRIHIWNPVIYKQPGNDTSNNITRSFYRSAHGAILIYDITNQQSFENIKNWLEILKNNADPDIDIYLVGNKADLDKISEEPSEQSSEDDVVTTHEYQISVSPCDSTHPETANYSNYKSIYEIPFTRTMHGELNIMRQVSYEQGEHFQKEHNLVGFTEVSSHNRRDIKK